MATRGKAWSKARAWCPRPEHAGSRVRFDGHYGKPGHRRQLYRCMPGNGDRPHRFTEVLPREEAVDRGVTEERALETVLGWLSGPRLMELTAEAIELYVWDRCGSEN